MTRFALLLAAIAIASVGSACGKSYPHEAVNCQSDADCATGHSCLPDWDRNDAGDCRAVLKSCQKQCTGDADCSYCGTFGICAKHVCDTGGPSTCGVFCGDGK